MATDGDIPFWNGEFQPKGRPMPRSLVGAGLGPNRLTARP